MNTDNLNSERVSVGSSHLVLPLRILRLTLKRKWFDMIASGEKTQEYRDPGKWILSRIIGKRYDVVEFSNGYGAHVPKVTVEYLGWHRGEGKQEWGALPGKQYAVLRLGKVTSRQNASMEAQPKPKDNE